MIMSEVDDQKQLTTHTCAGSITVPELFEAIDRLYDGDPTPNHLWDLLDADVSNLRTDQDGQLAASTKLRVPDRIGGRTALVTSSVLGSGLARAYQMHAATHGIRVHVSAFRSLEAASAWLEGPTEDTAV
jgi:hypothetical protein